MAILEGRWDCSSCGKVGNMGHDVHCSGCGKPRGKVQFYLPENAQELLDAEKLAEAKAGPDWICAYCEASNRSTGAHCTGCGAAREEGKARQEGGGDETELSAAQIEAKNRAAANVAPPPKSKKLGAVVAVVALLLMSCGGCSTLAFWSRAGGASGFGGPTFRFGSPSTGAWVTVTEKTATRSIAVEAQRMVQDASWCSSMPGDAHELRRHSKQDGTRCEWKDPARTLVPLAAVGGFYGTKNLNNGYFESSPSSGSSGGSSGSSSSSKCRNIPVYRDWCDWEAVRWTKVRVPSNTSADSVPAWPSVSLAPGEREGARTEEFLFDAQTSDGETVHMTTDESRWGTLARGAKYGATFSFFGGLKSVDDPVR